MKKIVARENNSQRAMVEERKNREQYFQTIERFVLAHRRGNMLLTPHEMFIIDRWLTRKIPLHVVMDGLRRAADYWQEKKKSRRTFNLAKVESFVLAAYQAYRERQLGRVRRQSVSGKTPGPRLMLREVISSFLDQSQERLQPLYPYFQEAMSILSRDKADETLLEELDEKIDRQLVALATSSERKRVAAEVQAKFSAKSKQEMREMVERALIKYLRHKFKIPYCAPYFY